jgi:hypothetical protein
VLAVEARAAVPNSGNSRFDAGPPGALLCQEGVNCGFTLPGFAPEVEAFTVAVIYRSQAEARTLASIFTGQTNNMIFLAEAEDRVLVKDRAGSIEVALPLARGAGRRLVILSFDGRTLRLEMDGHGGRIGQGAGAGASGGFLHRLPVEPGGSGQDAGSAAAARGAVLAGPVASGVSRCRGPGGAGGAAAAFPLGLLVDAPAPTLDVPPEMGLDQAATAGRFLIRGDHANLWFEGRGDALIVSFDNLATIDEGWPRGPWAWGRLEPLGHSVLGVQSHAKDWFRQPTAPALLRGLEERGFFRRFRRVVLTGASMGGFAALNFAPLIPEARVLAFSPQSTMNKVIAPFEQRFPFAVKRSNWEGMPFLDAAAAVPYIRRAVVLYDPFVPEDRAHAARWPGRMSSCCGCRSRRMKRFAWC